MDSDNSPPTPEIITAKAYNSQFGGIDDAQRSDPNNNNNNSNNQKSVSIEMDDDEVKEYSLICKCAAEFIAVTIFAFVGCSQGGGAIGFDGIVHAAFAHSLTIFLLVCCFGHISGAHINPAVTLAVALAGKISPIDAACYAVSQLAGGFLGGVICAGLLPGQQYDAIAGGATLVGAGFHWYQGLLAEVCTTFILCQSVLLTAADSPGHVLAPLAIGFSLLVDIFAAGNVSGASMNPARSFGPNLAASIFVSSEKRPARLWADHHIYWFGPAIGAMLAVTFYRLFFARRVRIIK